MFNLGIFISLWTKK